MDQVHHRMDIRYKINNFNLSNHKLLKYMCFKVTFITQELKSASGILHSVARDNEGLMKLGFKLNNLTGHANHFKIESSLGNSGTQKFNACISKHIPGSISSWFV